MVNASGDKEHPKDSVIHQTINFVPYYLNYCINDVELHAVYEIVIPQHMALIYLKSNPSMLVFQESMSVFHLFYSPYYHSNLERQN